MENFNEKLYLENLRKTAIKRNDKLAPYFVKVITEMLKKYDNNCS